MMKKGGNALILVTMVAPFLQNSPRYLIVSNTLIDHQLFIAKLNAYMVDTNSLYVLASYLEKRKQRTKVNGSQSNFDGIFSSIPQNSILGPLLFNICICDLYFGIGDLDRTSYADNNTSYTFSSELDVALKRLRSYTIEIFKWFPNSRLKSNAGNCNLITSSTSPAEIQLLGVLTGGGLDFDYHISQICKKASIQCTIYLRHVNIWIKINGERL